MLFTKDAWPGLVDGSITVTFRNWKRPQARAGGTSLTPVGLLAIESVRRVSVSSISDVDARRAGFDSRSDLEASLGIDPSELVFRVEFRFAGPDPRIGLRDSLPAPDELPGIVARLDRMDAAAAEPWTRASLRLIAHRPAVRAGDLATELGRERAAFKVDVRKLKRLGLTESLDVGYRLSPRGEAVLEFLGRQPPGV